MDPENNPDEESSSEEWFEDCRVGGQNTEQHSSMVQKRSNVSKLAANFTNKPSQPEATSAKTPPQKTCTLPIGSQPHKPGTGGSEKRRFVGRGRARGRKSFSVDEESQEVGLKKNRNLHSSPSIQQQDSVTDSNPHKKRSCSDDGGMYQANFDNANSEKNEPSDNQPCPQRRESSSPHSEHKPALQHEDEDDKPAKKAMKVSGFDETISEDILKLYFENIKSSGGGEIDTFMMHPSKKTSTLTFIDPDVCQRVLEQQHKLAGFELTVAVENNGSEEELNKIEVSGFSSTMHEDILKMYFESTKKSGGGELQEFQLNRSRNTAILTFADKSAFDRVLQQSHQLGDCTLTVEHRKQGGDTEPETFIEVSGFSSSIQKDILMMYFENSKKSGGGEIRSLEVDNSNKTAILAFVDESVTKRVLGRSHKLGGCTLSVVGKQETQPKSIPDEQTSAAVLEVSGFKPSTHEDVLLMYFESTNKSGGGDIDHFEMNKSNDTVIIVFTDTLVIDRVVQRKHKLGGKPLIVKKVMQNQMDDVETDEDDEPVPKLSSAAVLKVSGFKPSTHQDVLMMYFESTRKSGGGDIDHFEMNKSKDAVIITFTDHLVIDRVMQRTHKLSGKTLTVQKVMKDKIDGDETGDEDEIDATVERRKQGGVKEPETFIEVSGFSSSIQKDILMMYFESSKKSGGGEIRSLEVDNSNKTAILAFVDESVTKRVLGRSHKLGGCTLSVVGKQETQPKSIPDEETSAAVLEVSGFKPSTHEDVLLMYFESTNKSGGGDIDHFQMNKSNDTVIIVFTDTLVIDRVVQRKHRLGGNPLIVNKVMQNQMDDEETDEDDEPVPKLSSAAVLKVSGFKPSTHQDVLMMYFESTRKSGGGDIDHFEMNKSKDAVIITFTDHLVIDRVMQRTHKLSGKTLTVQKVMKDKIDGDETSDEDEVDAPQRAIEVSGFKPTTHQDTLVMYFENRKSGGSEIADCKVNDRTNTAILSFLDPSVTDVVLRKQHTLDGATLRVVEIKVRPRLPKDKSRIFLKGLPDDCQKDTLALYVENRMSKFFTNETEIAEVVYGERPGTAMLQFVEEIQDMKPALQNFEKRKFKQNVITAEEVETTDGILVQGLKDGTSKEMLELYFENTRKSGGGPIRESVLDSDVNKAVVYFEEERVVSSVMQKKSHQLDGSHLIITSFYDFLGMNASTEGPVPRIPKPVPCEVDPQIMQHIKGNESENLTATMKEVCSEVLWPNDGNKSEALIKPLESSADEDISWHHWQQRSTKKLMEYCQQFQSDSLPIPKAIWADLSEKLQELHITDVTITERPDQSIILMIGKCSEVDAAKKIILPAVRDLQEKAERDARTIEKKLKLSPLKFKFFSMCNLSAALQVETAMLYETTEILFKGIRADISEAQVEMYKMFESMQTRHLEAKKYPQIFKFTRRFVEKINEALKSQGINAVCDVDETKVNIYGVSNHELDKAWKLVHDNVVSKKTSTDRANVLAALQAVEGTTTIQRINNEKIVIVTLHEEKKELQITGFSDAVEDTLADISKFLEENVKIEQMVPLPSGHINFLTGFCSSVFESVQKRFKKATIQAQTNGLLVSGNEKECHAVISELQELKSSIVQRTHTVDKTGMPELLRQEKGTSKLNQIGNDCKCVIEIQKPEGVATKTGDVPLSEDDFETLCYYQTPEGRRLVVSKGDLTKENVDAVVNAANERLDHIGGLAKAIVDAGGSEIQRECHRLLKKRKRTLNTSEVICTSPGKLPCRHIIHVVGPIFRASSAAKAEDLLFDAITNSLKEAHTKQLKSISIPAVSAGMYGFPTDLCAKVIIEATVEFIKTEPQTSLTEIRFTNNTVAHSLAFQRALKDAFGNDVQSKPKRIDLNPAHTAPNPARVSHAYARHRSKMVFSERKLSSPSEPVDTRTPVTIEVFTRFQKVSSDRVKTLEGKDVVLMKGSIAQDQADVIVNTTSGEMNLSQGNVSNALLKAGGQSLQQECDDQLTQQDGTRQLVPEGDFIETGAGNLQCQKIYHSYCPSYKRQNAVTVLRTMIANLLQKADSDGMTSIAIPAIGTGILGFPRDIVAKVMFEGVAKFSQGNKGSSLQDIHFWVYDKDAPTIQAFEDEILRRVSDDPKVSPVPTLSQPKKLSRRKIKKPAGAVALPILGASFDSLPLHHKVSPYKSFHSTSSRPDTASFVSLPSSPKAAASFDNPDSTFGPITVEVEQGDITKDVSEAIVNTVGKDLGLKGPVSTAILRAGGQVIADECDNIRTGKSPIPMINITTAGSLPSQYIIHVTLRGPETVKKMTRDILKMAEEKKIKSVAFPALGTGNIGGSPQQVATAIIDAISEFALNEKPTHLQVVKLTIFQKEMVPIFKSTLNNKTGNVTKKPEGFVKRATRMMKDTYYMITGAGSYSEADDDLTVYPMESNREKESITLIIISNDDSNINKAVAKIDRFIEEEFLQDFCDVDDQNETISPTVLKSIRQLGKQNNVYIEICPDKPNRVILEGHSSNVTKTNTQILKQLARIRQEEGRKAEDTLINSQVKWRYQADTGLFENYEDEANAMIERAHRKKRKSVELNLEGGKVKIDFQKMIEIDTTGNKSDIVVHRVDLKAESHSVVPSNWTPMGDKNVEVVTLHPGTPGYNKVEAAFKSGYSPNSIIQIERIQNLELYKQYAARKEAMDKRRGADSERTVYHGTSRDTIDKINHRGFNRSYCGKNATMHGRGTYFARDADYSARSTYSPADDQGHKHMYICKVLVGDYVKGDSSTIAPPNKPGSQDIYDCTVDNEQDPCIFVIYHDVQAYPEYHIAFK